MNSDVYMPADSVPGHPVLRVLTAFPIACFSGALAADVAYALTAQMLWADFSAWLLAAGLLFCVLAALAGLVDLIANRRVRRARPTWAIAIGGLLVIGLALLNNLVHSRDAWTSVVPQGLALSAVTVIVLLATVWLGSGRGYRRAAVVAVPEARA